MCVGGASGGEWINTTSFLISTIVSLGIISFLLIYLPLVKSKSEKKLPFITSFIFISLIAIFVNFILFIGGVTLVKC